MRSNNRTVSVSKAVNLGYMPVFVSMIHRHLEKEKATGVVADFGTVDFAVPVDMLRLSVSDPELVRSVSGVTFTYRVRK